MKWVRQIAEIDERNFKSNQIVNVAIKIIQNQVTTKLSYH